MDSVIHLLNSWGQKHYPDLGSDASSLWNFWPHFSDVISRANHRWRREISAFLVNGILKLQESVRAWLDVVVFLFAGGNPGWSYKHRWVYWLSRRKSAARELPEWDSITIKWETKKVLFILSLSITRLFKETLGRVSASIEGRERCGWVSSCFFNVDLKINKEMFRYQISPVLCLVGTIPRDYPRSPNVRASGNFLLKESGIHEVESRIQNCLGFPYMGRPGHAHFDKNSSWITHMSTSLWTPWSLSHFKSDFSFYEPTVRRKIYITVR